MTTTRVDGYIGRQPYIRELVGELAKMQGVDYVSTEDLDIGHFNEDPSLPEGFVGEVSLTIDPDKVDILQVEFLVHDAFMKLVDKIPQVRLVRTTLPSTEYPNAFSDAKKKSRPDDLSPLRQFYADEPFIFTVQYVPDKVEGTDNPPERARHDGFYTVDITWRGERPIPSTELEGLADDISSKVDDLFDVFPRIKLLEVRGDIIHLQLIIHSMVDLNTPRFLDSMKRLVFETIMENLPYLPDHLVTNRGRDLRRDLHVEVKGQDDGAQQELIRMGYEKPDLRPHITPILDALYKP